MCGPPLHYGLEMELQTQHNGPVEHAMLATKKVATPRKTQIPREIPPGSGMIDSGATCSAGPETSVQRLVTKIMEADAAAQIRVETKDQPRFRFGSGKWGQALYKLIVSHLLQGVHAVFHVLHYLIPKNVMKIGLPWTCWFLF